MHTKRAYWGVFAMAEFSRIRFFSSFPSGQLTFGVSTTELNRIYHGDLRMSIQHEIGEKHVLKAKAAYAKSKNNRKRSDGKEAEPEPDFVKKRDKEIGAGQPHTANKYPTQKDRKTQENTRDFAACTLLYTI